MDSRIIEERWQLVAGDWRSWGLQEERRSALAAPTCAGVYVFRVAEPSTIPRAVGQSDIAYVGKARERGLQARLLEHDSGRINEGEGRRIKRLRGKYPLQVTWKALGEPEKEETELLLLYEIDHFELPPCNRARKDPFRDVLLYAGLPAEIVRLPRETLLNKLQALTGQLPASGLRACSREVGK